MKAKTLGLLGALLLCPVITPADAADKLKIGLVTTLTGPSAGLGQDMLDGFNLALKGSDGRLGGVPVDLVTGDDQAKPDVARQLVDRMIERDRVDLLTGFVFSNVLLAVTQPVFKAQVPLVSLNAGPSQLAGAQCNPFFYAASWQNDNSPEAMGGYLQDQGVKRIYLMAPNYPAGKDKLAGFKRFYKGEVAAEVYTQFGQLDYAAELAELRAAKPDAVFVFYPGGMGINFLKQYAQAGLSSTLPLYGEMNTLDQTILPAAGEAAIGARTAVFWSETMLNPPNVAFVQAFRKAYGRIPSPFAAQGYDGARLLDAALKASGGKVADKPAFRQAMEKAEFKSVRGSFRFAANHFPIQDWYLARVEKAEDGTIVAKTEKPILKNHGDAYAGDCRMAQ